MGSASGIEWYLLLKHIHKEHYKRSFVLKRKSCPKLRLCGRSFPGRTQTQNFHLAAQWPWCCQVLSAFRFLCCWGEKTYYTSRSGPWPSVFAHSCWHCVQWDGCLMLATKDWHCRCPGNTRGRSWRSICFAYRVRRTLKLLWYFLLRFHANIYGFLLLSVLNIF